jgi:hypothetical protein
VYEAFDLNSFGFNLCKQRSQKEPLTSTRSRTVSGIGLSHGDILYLVPANGTQLWSAPSTSSASNNTSTGIQFDSFTQMVGATTYETYKHIWLK